MTISPATIIVFAIAAIVGLIGLLVAGDVLRRGGGR